MNEEILRELERLRKRNGGILLPEKVVEAARDKKSPLHAEFEWNDAKAANTSRLEQARALIRAYKIVHLEMKAGIHPIGRRYDNAPPFYSPTPLSPSREGYRPTAELLGSEHRRRLLVQEYERAYGHARRYFAYLREAGLRQAAERLDAAFAAVRATLEELAEPEAGD